MSKGRLNVTHYGIHTVTKNKNRGRAQLRRYNIDYIGSWGIWRQTRTKW